MTHIVILVGDNGDETGVIEIENPLQFMIHDPLGHRPPGRGAQNRRPASFVSGAHNRGICYRGMAILVTAATTGATQSRPLPTT